MIRDFIYSESKISCSICNQEIKDGAYQAHSCVPHLLDRISRLEDRLDRLYRRVTDDDIGD